MQLHSFCCFLLLHSCCLRPVLTQCWLASAATVAWLRFPGFKTLFEVKFLRRNLRYHPPSPLFTLSPGCSLVVWCLVVNPPTEPLFHRATLSCELAGSSAASLCSSHPLHGAVELETTRNFCDQGTPASSKSVHKHKISVVKAPTFSCAAAFPLSFFAAAHLWSAPCAHPMLAC